MPRALRCTGSRWPKLLPAGDGHGRPTKGCQQGGALAPPQARHPRASRGVAPSLYKADAAPHLSRELLIRAVAYRMQEVALGGLRPEPQRQLRQIAMEL